jgi:hypothetical protein
MCFGGMLNGVRDALEEVLGSDGSSLLIRGIDCSLNFMSSKDAEERKAYSTNYISTRQ